MALTKKEAKQIAEEMAPLMVKQIQKSHHEFSIDPERHYTDHQNINRLNEIFTEDLIAALKEVSASYKKGRNIVWTMFLTLVSIGALWTAFNGWITDKLPK